MSLLEENWRRREEEAAADRYFRDADAREAWWSGANTTPPPDTGVDKDGKPIRFRKPDTRAKEAWNRAVEYQGRAQMVTDYRPQQEKWERLSAKSFAEARAILDEEAARAQGGNAENLVGAEGQLPEQLAQDGHAALAAQGVVEPPAPTPPTPPEAQ